MDARLYGVYEAGTGREQLRQYGNGLREGLRFIAAEKGLLILIAFMALSELCHNVMNTVTLPWFKSPEGLGVQAYTWLGVFGVPGLLVLAFAGSLASVGAYVQRNSGMQSYVPNAVRARFNSAASITASLGAGWRRITTVFVNTGDA